MYKMFERHSEKRKTNLSSIDEKKIEAFIEKQIGSDLQLKAQMVGFICGLFSSAELKVYLAHEKELKKRIVSMLIQRLKSIYHVTTDYT